MIIGFVSPLSACLARKLILDSQTGGHHVVCRAAYTSSREFWAYKFDSEGGFFKARLSFPSEFPLLPPKMRFLTPMWHPNSKQRLCYHNSISIFTFLAVYPDGVVCVSILVSAPACSSPAPCSPQPEFHSARARR